MSTKCDPVIGISSFNSAETITACGFWRRKILTNDAASSFRVSGSLLVACTAIRRRTIYLNRQLGVQNEKKSKSVPSSGEEFSAIHELVRLVGNVTFFDSLSRLMVKDADVVQHLGTLLEYDDLRLDIVASIIRLFGNLCESKESALSVLQTKPCVRAVVHRLTKDLEKDLERQENGEANDAQQSQKSCGDSTQSAQGGKIREHCIRTLRNAALYGKNFAYRLIRFDAVYAAGRFVRLCIGEPGGKKNLSKNCDNALQILLSLLPLKDHNFSQQLLRADMSAKLMELVTSSDLDENSRRPAVKLLLGMITQYSSLRVDLSKCGAIEWTKDRVEKLIDVKDWSSGIGNEDSAAAEAVLALSRFCRDCYIRTKLQECHALDLLLNLFISGDLNETKVFYELMSAFLCFLYDGQGLKYLVEYDGFLYSVVRIVQRFTTDYPCHAPHFSTWEESGSQGDTAVEADAAVCEFRPDSPSYKKFRVGPTASIDGDFSYTGPMCKDFTSGWPPVRNVSSPTSPGPSWSPSASSLQSFSSAGSSSSALGGNKNGNGSKWSSASDRSVDDLEYNWEVEFEFDCGRRYSSCSVGPSPHALCDCDMPSGEDLSTYKNRERLLWTAVKLLSWLSHSDHASLLVNSDYLAILLAYIGGVCRPEPRVGRLVERLARNRLFTQSLLGLEFHRLVIDELCTSKCRSADASQKLCSRCKRLSKIGCNITQSFRAQVDTDFGFGTLEHMMWSGGAKRKLTCLRAMLYLMKSNSRARRLLADERRGLRTLVDALSSNDSDEETVVATVKAFCVAIEKDDVRERFKQLSSRAIATTECTLSTGNMDSEHCVSFLEKEGHGRIDCDVRTLVASSPFYRALFSGSYSESSQRVFIYDEGDSASNFAAFVFYVHFLHGCRNCVIAKLDAPAECLSVLELADKRLCCALGEFVVSECVATFLRDDNVTEFIFNAILRRDLALFKLCMDFVIGSCGVDDFVKVVTIFRSSDHSLDFFQMLFNYLKTEIGLQ